MRGPTWEQFSRAGRFALGAGILSYGTVVTAVRAPGAVPFVLAAGLTLLGLSVTLPWERKNGGRKEDE